MTDTPHYRQLARLLADAAADKKPVDQEQVRRLVAALATDATADDEAGEAALDDFFRELGTQLHVRGAHMPSLEQLPPEALPLVQAFAAAIEPDPTTGAIDFEAAAERLDASFGRFLGERPREAAERRLRADIDARIAATIADALRANGLVPAVDTTTDSDEFWDVVDLHRKGHRRFLAKLAQLSEDKLMEFYWAHTAAVMELQGAGLDDRAAAWIVAQGFERHTQAVADVRQAPEPIAGEAVDLRADAERVYRERFGRDIRLGV